MRVVIAVAHPEEKAVASLPTGAIELTLEEAVRYFRGWSVADRQVARDAIARVGVTRFYSPPSGGYVAGHGGGSYGRREDEAVNGIVLYAGYLHLWPNLEEWQEDERIELSTSRGSLHRQGGPRRTGMLALATCPRCHCELPAVGGCDNCD
jgi:hypothetical protein